ncbi:MAG: glycoside hydrolase family 95 protein [Akkermansiaceae bacterium]|nr:glycoside hydrolase family 95 protein [Akkermansiaceae bacterium]
MTPRTYITTITLLSAGITMAADAPATSELLWYKQPAIVDTATLPFSHAANIPGKLAPNSKDSWESQTLPVGNGRIGGTIFGGDKLDCVCLNEVSLWSGGPNKPKNGHNYLYGPEAGQDQFGSYQPFGNLYVSFNFRGEPQNYSRCLDLKKATAYTTFTANGIKYTRECFASRPDNVLVYAATADKKGSITADIALTPYHDVDYSVSGNTIIMKGKLANGQEFEGRALVKVLGGKATVKGQAGGVDVTYKGKGDKITPIFSASHLPYIHVEGADSVVILVSLATDYKMDYDANWKGDHPTATNIGILRAAEKKSLKTLRKAHREDYQAYYNRLSINLGKSPKAVANLPTDERLAVYRKYGKPDPELEATIYQYGRYVLIAGSQPGNLPVNLQGIWNNKVHAPWASDYHNNINLQMCYWGAEVANLSECHMPLIDFIRAMEKPLHEMTKAEFGPHVRGWTTRISQNPWGGGGWIKWNPPVNAWYALHIWDHYLYTHDETYLREIAYPMLKTICHYWEDELKEVGADGVGLKTTGPKGAILNLSAADHPELKEIKPGSLVCPMGWSHEWGPVEDGCAHDQQLIWELFDNTIKAAAILGIDAEWAATLADKRDRLVGNRIGRDGYLQEWIVDRPNMVKGQRHTSHLIGVFPGTSISMAKTPEFAKAAMKSLELRGLSGDNRRSWTWPWRTALWARFGHTENAYSMVQHYIRYNLLDNLFGNHPPMQMDGTYGMTGGMSEMLIQSHAGQIELLPTLPDAWKNGSVKGIRARGNITVDMQWKDGKVTTYKLTTTTPTPEPVKVIVNGETKTITPEVVK